MKNFYTFGSFQAGIWTGLPYYPIGLVGYWLWIARAGSPGLSRQNAETSSKKLALKN